MKVQWYKEDGASGDIQDLKAVRYQGKWFKLKDEQFY